MTKRFSINRTSLAANMHSPPTIVSAKNAGGNVTPHGTASTDNTMIDPSWAPTTI